MSERLTAEELRAIRQLYDRQKHQDGPVELDYDTFRKLLVAAEECHRLRERLRQQTAYADVNVTPGWVFSYEALK